MRKLLIALVLPILLLLPSGPALGAISWRPATVNSDVTTKLRDLVAAEHKRVCGKSLVHDSQLIWVARWKAQDMGYRGYFAHKTLDGKYVWDFYARAGINWAGGAGEILAWNNYDDAISPVAAYKGFMASPGHKAVIQSCKNDRFGVGVFKIGSGRKYFVVEFTNNG